MSGEEEKNIDLMISGRSYSLRIKGKDELSIRKLADEINEKVKNLQLSYSRKDKQDCLAIALLTYAVENYKLNQDSDDDAPENERIDALNGMISKYLV